MFLMLRTGLLATCTWTVRPYVYQLHCVNTEVSHMIHKAQSVLLSYCRITKICKLNILRWVNSRSVCYNKQLCILWHYWYIRCHSLLTTYLNGHQLIQWGTDNLAPRFIQPSCTFYLMILSRLIFQCIKITLNTVESITSSIYSMQTTLKLYDHNVSNLQHKTIPAVLSYNESNVW